MGFSCGIVGLPNVGKSTLFNALTHASVKSENFPFCTIEPNVGTVPVPDLRLDRVAKFVQPKKIIPGVMNFVDIAGLIQGASRGEGLGNKFLSHVRDTDAIAHVVRCFPNDDVIHTPGDIDPLRDIEILNLELTLADLEHAERIRARLSKRSRIGDKAARKQESLLSKVVDHLNRNEPIRSLELTDAETDQLRQYQFLTGKTVLYIANISEDEADSAHYVKTLREFARDDAGVIEISAKIEEEISQLPVAERAEFLIDAGIEISGLDRVIQAGYRSLGLHHFFTADEKEARAWTIPYGTPALQAAGKIHTDFERGFIRAEVISYDDYIDCGGESHAKERGLCRSEGRDYVIQEAEVVRFKFNVTNR